MPSNAFIALRSLVRLKIQYVHVQVLVESLREHCLAAILTMETSPCETPVPGADIRHEAAWTTEPAVFGMSPINPSSRLYLLM